MRRCIYCDKPYVRGTMIDVGVGFIQVSEDEPDCSCEYEEWLECANCGENFLEDNSDAVADDRFCSSECEEEYEDDC